MKNIPIRDLFQYIQSVCEKTDSGLIGKDEEPFLQTSFGTDSHVKDLIHSVAKFASNVYVQVFYEFIQNAFDSNAEHVLFFANEDYLIVVNNGTPFKTATDAEKRKSESGQLYSFLTKNKSAKSKDTDQLGKYGQGSKLLYSLIADIDEDKQYGELMTDAIYHQKKGPYLLSWNNQGQFLNFLELEDYIREDCNNYEDALLFCKISMCYYPVMPKQNETLFSSDEVNNIKSTIENLINPRKYINPLTNGTMVIVPLGKGVYDTLRSEINLNKVWSGIHGFTSVLGGLKENYKKRLDKIVLFGHSIDVKENYVEKVVVKTDFGNKSEYSFYFHPSFAEGQNVNFFAGLPIHNTQFNLGFLVECESFDLTDSRQDFFDYQKTFGILGKVFALLIKDIEAILERDSERFSRIYDSLLATRIAETENGIILKNIFQEHFSPFFQRNVKTQSKSYSNISRVYKHNSNEYEIPFESINLQGDWVDSETANLLKENHGIEVTTKKFKDVVIESDLESYILGLPVDQYRLFHNQCLKSCWNDELLCDKKLYKSSAGVLYSKNEIEQGKVLFSNKTFPPEFLTGNNGLEFIIQDLQAISCDNESKSIINYIKNNISLFQGNICNSEVACKYLSKIEIVSNSIFCFEKDKISLFKDLRNDYKSFSELIAVRPQGTCLFDCYLVMDTAPSCKPNWFASIDWAWILGHIQELKSIQDWDNLNERYLSDIMSIYQLESHISKNTQIQRVRLYLDENGVPTDDEYVSFDYSLTDNEFQQLTKCFDRISFVPQRFRRILSQVPFDINKVKFKELIEEGYSYELSDALLMLNKDISLVKEYQIVQTSNNQFVFNKISDFQPYYLDDIYANNTIISIFQNTKYTRIPSILFKNITNSDIRCFDIVQNPDRLKDVILKVNDKLCLLDIVANCNKDIKDFFINHLDVINIDNFIEKEDLKWKILLFAQKENYISNVFQLLRYRGHALPASLKKNELTYNNHEYELYNLLPQERTANQLIIGFFRCLPDDSFFRENFYAGKIEETDARNIWKELLNRDCNVEQLRFAFDYALKENETCQLSKENCIAQSEVLDMILLNNYKNFDTIYRISGYDKDINVYADGKYLLNNELLPKDLREWLDLNKNGKELFSGLRDERDLHIQLRKSVLEDDYFDKIDKLSLQKLSLDIEWIKNKKIAIYGNSNRFKTLDSLFQNFDMGTYLKYENTINNDNQIEFSLSPYKATGFFLQHDKNADFSLKYKEKQEIRNFFSNNIVYYFKEKYRFELGKRNVDNTQLLSIIEECDDNNIKIKELDGNYYEEWKQGICSKGITIYSTNDIVPGLFKIVNEKTVLLSVTINTDECGYNKSNKRVVFKNNAVKTELDILSEVSQRDGFKEFQAPFIALQALYIKYLKRIRTFPGGGLGSGGGFWGNGKNDEPEETPLSTICGYIGEQLYKKFLDYKKMSYEYSAEFRVGAYDFKLGDTYIDVKTNVKTLKDGATPFYVHSSQHRFLRENPEADFKMFRISLTDLGLCQEYRDIKAKYSNNEDPRLNSQLSEECNSLADRFWNKIDALKLFVNQCHEYKIRLIDNV